MWTISKDYKLSASHVLEGLPNGHQCGRLHGHNYVVRVELTGDRLDDHGFILDYGELKPFGAYIDQVLDHRHLNDVFPGMQTSSENLARLLAGTVRLTCPIPEGVTVAVSISETPTSWCRWSE